MVSDANAVIRVDSSIIASNQPFVKNLVVGDNPLTFVVTAENGSTKSYNFTIKRPLSNVASLSSLTNSASPISFSSNFFSYSTPPVASTVDSTIISATSTDPNATITVNGTSLLSGASTAPIPLAFGANTITIVCTAADGIATNTYTISITRNTSTVRTLSALSISSGTLSPTFDTNLSAYTATVSHETTEITVTPTLTDSNATLLVNGTPSGNGTPSQAIPLNVGTNSIVIRVNAQRTPFFSNHTITVTRLASQDATLASITPSTGNLAPAFSPNVMQYSIEVPSHQNSIIFQHNTNHPLATAQINGVSLANNTNSAALPLVTGANVFDFVVSAQDPTSKITYRVTVNRAPSTDSSLANLTNNRAPLTPIFSSDVLQYTCTVDSAVSSIQFTPTPSHVAASVRVNQTPVSNGTASTDIPLVMGKNMITVDVIAEDAVTTTQYQVLVIRTPALHSLQFSDGTLTPSFSPARLNYDLLVSSGTVGIAVTPSAANPEVSILVNGTAVTSGSASATLPMQHTLAITVTAIGAGDVRTDYIITAQDRRDPDADGLSNYEEIQIYQTNPTINDTDGDGLSDGAEVLAGLNPNAIDSDEDGLPDNIETATGGTNTPAPRVSDAVAYNFSHLITDGKTLKLLGKLPPGLKFNPTTGLITGVVTAKPGIYSFSLLLMNGRTTIQTIPVSIPVQPYPTSLLGTFQAMLHDISGHAIGMIDFTITAPGKYSATMNRSDLTATLKAKGVFVLNPGRDEVQLRLNFPNQPVFVNLEVLSPLLTGTHSLGSVHGHRLARGTELPLATEKSTVVFDHGMSDGISAPAGLGSATLTLLPNGNATMIGQTGDAKPFTAKANLTSSGQIMFWVKPYKSTSSYFGGVINVRAGTQVLANQVVWKKSAIAGDTSYASGFGPFSFPATAITHQTPSSSASLLSLWQSSSSTISLVVDGAGLPNLGNTVPTNLVLGADYKLTSTVPSPWAMQITSNTGVIKGTMSWTASGEIATGRSNILGVITPSQPNLFGAGLIIVPMAQPKGSYRTAAWTLELP